MAFLRMWDIDRRAILMTCGNSSGVLVTILEICVLISVRNGEAFVGQTARSVSAQTFEAVKFVVVNDGSTDATPQLVGDWGRTRPARSDHLAEGR